MEFVEVQGSGEEATFSPDQLARMLDLARLGIAELLGIQRRTIAAAAEAVVATPWKG